MEQDIQNNKKLNEIFKQLINAVNTPFTVNTPFNFVFSPMYKNTNEEEEVFSSFIQPCCQPGYNSFDRFLD